MLTQIILVKDQFGAQYQVKATLAGHFNSCAINFDIQHITYDGEDIRPSFEMLFQSNLNGKIFKII